VSWPGHRIGRAVIDPVGEVLFYSAHRNMDEVLYVLTPGGVYGISVDDPVSFADTIQAHLAWPALFEPEQAVHRTGLAAQTFWLDRYALLLTAALGVAFLLVLGYVLEMYPGLPATVELRFPAVGGVVRVADRSDLLDIPRAAFAIAIVNLGLAAALHSGERMVSYVLLVAAIATQAILLVGAAVAVA
jgi:hypothetical protein